MAAPCSLVKACAGGASAGVSVAGCLCVCGRAFAYGHLVGISACTASGWDHLVLHKACHLKDLC